MPHEKNATSNIISSIQLPDGNTYEIHDASAIHSIEDLSLPTYLVFKGSVDKIDDLPSEHDTGDVYHVTEDNCEYVWIEDKSDWEPLGNVHDAAASDHVHNVTVNGSTTAQPISVTGNVPCIEAHSQYLSASSEAPSIETGDDQVLGAGTTFSANGEATTTKISTSRTANVVLNTESTATVVTGFKQDHSTKVALGSDATFSASGTATTQKMETSTVSVLENVGTCNPGSEAEWSAEVKDGVLSFAWTKNTPTSVTMPTFKEETVATGNLVAATATENAGASVATGINTISVSVENKDEVTAITGISELNTDTVLKDVSVETQPEFTINSGNTGVEVATGISSITVSANDNDKVTAITSVEAGAPTITLGVSDNNGGVEFVSSVTETSNAATLTGTVPAQDIELTGVTAMPKVNTTPEKE